nr:discoidin domain-containing protein [Cohnella zeiphila]
MDARTGALETFLDFKGSAPGNRVHNITVSGLTFEYTKYQYPIDKNYVKPGQAGLADGVYDGSRRQPAAIQLEAADRITLERNVIRHTGATAIDIRGSSGDNRVIGNAITDIGGSGIFEGLFSEPGANTTDPTRITKGNVIENNYLNGISLTSCGVGIISGFSQNVTIAHNEVANTDYSGISMGWGWTANDTSLLNNNVEDNNIYGVMKALADGAAIYTLSKTPNSQIAGNYIHDIDSSEFASNYPVAGIYLDQATSGYNIANNVMTRVGQTFYANVVADDGNTLTNNDSQDPAIIANAGLEPAYWDIVPGAELDHDGREIAATERGSVRIDGTVASSETAGSTDVSITRNDAAVWSGHVAAQASASFNLNIDVEPGDVIRFGPQTGVTWHSEVKPEAYTPNLVIDKVTFDGMADGAPKIDYRNRIYTVLAKPDVDLGDLDVTVTTPPGTRAGRIGGDSQDYRADAVFRIRLDEGSNNPDFEGGVKYKDWKLKVLRDSESVSVDGYNLANELNDVDNWTTAGGSKKVVDNGIQFNGGYALYEGKKFNDELATFHMKTSDSGWPSIVFRVQDGGTDPIGPGNASYITVIKSTGIELQRFNDGVRTVFYGNVGGLPSVFGDAIPNTMFDFDKDNLVQVGAMNADDGVRLVLYINGKLVFDCKDTADGRIEAPGYLGTYQADNSVTLSRAPQAGGGDGEPPSVRPLLEVELGKAKALLDGADIGDGNGQYPQWAKEYLQWRMGEAQSRYNQAEATEEELNAGLSDLKAAEAAFAKSRNVPVNVALGKPTTSSEEGKILVGYGPDKAVDGVIGFGNGWSAESGVWPDGKSIKPWLTIDLQAAYSISAAEVVARPNGNYDGERKTFEIQASNDPDFAEGQYTVLGKVDATPFEGDSWRLDVTDPQPYRYIRYAKTNVDYAFVSELSVWSASKPELYSVGGTVKDSAGNGVSGAEVDVYSAAADSDTPLGTAVSGDDGSYAVSPALPAGKYLVKATGADGLVAEQTVFLPYADATDVDLALLPDLSIEPGRWKIESPLLTDASGRPLLHLEASGKVRADVKIANLQAEPQEATLILALYAPDHSLASYADGKMTVAAGGTVHLQTGLQLPGEVDGYTLKVLVWDTLEGMHPLAGAVPLP